MGLTITPDYKRRNDGYDENTVRYYESIEEDYYFYELYVLVDDIKSRIIIIDDGVSVDFITGGKKYSKKEMENLYDKRKTYETL